MPLWSLEDSHILALSSSMINPVLSPHSPPSRSGEGDGGFSESSVCFQLRVCSHWPPMNLSKWSYQHDCKNTEQMFPVYARDATFERDPYPFLRQVSEASSSYPNVLLTCLCCGPLCRCGRVCFEETMPTRLPKHYWQFPVSLSPWLPALSQRQEL